MSDKRSPRLATKSLSARGRSFNTSPVKFSNGTEGFYRSAINLVIRRQPSKETKDIAGYQQPRLLDVRNEPEIQVWTSELKEKHHRNKQNQNQQHRQKYHQKLEHEQLTRDTHFGHDHQCRHGPESRGYPKLRTTQHPKEDHGRKRSPAVIKGKVLLRVPSAYPVTDSLEVPGSQDSQDNDDSHRFKLRKFLSDCMASTGSLTSGSGSTLSQWRSALLLTSTSAAESVARSTSAVVSRSLSRTSSEELHRQMSEHKRQAVEAWEKRAQFALRGRKMTLPAHNAFGKFGSSTGKKDLSLTPRMGSRNLPSRFVKCRQKPLENSKRKQIDKFIRSAISNSSSFSRTGGSNASSPNPATQPGVGGCGVFGSLGRLTPEIYTSTYESSECEGEQSGATNNGIATTSNASMSPIRSLSSHRSPSGPGKIQFSLEYCHKTENLKVWVEGATELSLLSSSSSSPWASLGKLNVGLSVLNPQVEVSLIPPGAYEASGNSLKEKRRQSSGIPGHVTHVQKRTANPTFDEVFELPVRWRDVSEKMLLVSVVNFPDKTGRRASLIGYYLVKDIELYGSQNTVYSFNEPLHYPSRYQNRLPAAVTPDTSLNNSSSSRVPEKGQLSVSLLYLSGARRLSVTVHKAAHLTAMDFTTASSDPFVKLWLSTSSSDSTTLTCGGSGKRGVIGGSSGSGRKSRRTGVRKRTLHPVFQEAFLFPLEACDVDTIVVHLQVIDYDRYKRNDLIGSVALGSRLGLGSNGDRPGGGVVTKQGASQWAEATRHNPGKSVYRWHDLQ
ncbi:uncharacterized protein LOC142354133 [Convolutriloba macropyga]|uniref:uncharacterized protein LOC142354133 n=1 Tax=Convolutriloba macropyga TaxID=536237 RepID=UPI003F51BAFB